MSLSATPSLGGVAVGATDGPFATAGAAEEARSGKKVFHSIGCADCHTPDLGSVDGIYSDLLLHRMGSPLVGGGSYNEPPPEIPDFKPGEDMIELRLILVWGF